MADIPRDELNVLRPLSCLPAGFMLQIQLTIPGRMSPSPPEVAGAGLSLRPGAQETLKPMAMVVSSKASLRITAVSVHVPLNPSEIGALW